MKPKMCCCLVPAAVVELPAVALLLTLVTSLALRQLQSQRVAHFSLAVQPRAQAPVNTRRTPRCLDIQWLFEGGGKGKSQHMAHTTWRQPAVAVLHFCLSEWCS